MTTDYKDMYASLSPQVCGCRTECCPHCLSADFKRNGSFHRKDDGRRVQRFLCKACLRSFSRAGFSPYYRHWHRRHNEMIRKLFATGNTQRDIARNLKLDKDTVGRRLAVLAKMARVRHLRDRAKAPIADRVQFDELITFEHTKMKPVSVSVFTDVDRWRILDVQVAQIPANGLLAKKAKEKYGPRPDHSLAARATLMARSVARIHPNAHVITDMHSAYAPLVKRFLPKATHVTHRGAKGSANGFGELKKLGFDPLFCINHQFATMRSGVSRLARRTWSTTKRIERLKNHLMIFIDYYNRSKRPKSALEFERFEAAARAIIKKAQS